MDGLILGAIVLVILFSLGRSNRMSEGMDITDLVKEALQSEIIAPLGLPGSALGALYAQAHVETGGFTARYFSNAGPSGDPPTWSLFNRHKGEGVLGVPDSDGYWTGQTRYISAMDPDLRVYTDIHQSARDMKQWLLENSHREALQALHRGDVQGYFEALGRIGFSTQSDYVQVLQARYNEVAV